MKNENDKKIIFEEENSLYKTIFSQKKTIEDLTKTVIIFLLNF